MTADHEARKQETEQLLRKALHQHAQRVEPSLDAFFKINQRIVRKEERLKLPAILRVRLQPSMVASIVLLIALTVVTTLLLTRDDNPSQPVDIAATPTSAAPEPPETPPVTQPANPVPDPAAEEPDEQEGRSEPGRQIETGSQEGQSETGGQGETGGQVDTAPAPDTTPDTTSQPTSPPAPTTLAPTTTTEEPPATDPPPPPDLSYAIRPLQVAGQGQVIVYADHNIGSEQLGVIPVSSEGDDYLATGIRATDYDGKHWSEVRLPSGETGWVELETVAIIPATLTGTAESNLITAGYQLLGVIEANEIAENGEEVSAANIFLPSTSLNVSSRGVYVASVFGPGAVYVRHSPSDFLAAFGVEDAEESQPNIASLYSQLACLAGNADVTFGGNSDIAAPTAMQVLPYVAITGIGTDNTCRVLVYFDYLRGQAEIIGFSVHS